MKINSQKMDSNCSGRIKEVESFVDVMDKAKSLIKVLNDDSDACDFKWTLFIAAANSYKYDSLLKPFPNDYVENRVLNIASLREVIATIPKFKFLLHLLRNAVEKPNGVENCDISNKAINLLYWCLISTKEPTLQSVNRANFDHVLQKVISVVPGPKPTHIFEVSTSTDSNAEEKFRGYCQKFKTSFAYHGSKLESFHSILNYGLQQHLCKTALYGEGIYLSSEPHVSLMFSPTGYGWENSSCGKRNSCLAFCEFVNHPIHLKCHTKEKNDRTGVPDKYFVITNNEIVRLRYLVVYGMEITKSERNSLVHENALFDWIYRHKWLTVMVIYAVILMIIGASNSRHGHYMRQYMRRATLNAINYIKTLDLFSFNLLQTLFK